MVYSLEDFMKKWKNLKKIYFLKKFVAVAISAGVVLSTIAYFLLLL